MPPNMRHQMPPNMRTIRDNLKTWDFDFHTYSFTAHTLDPTKESYMPKFQNKVKVENPMAWTICHPMRTITKALIKKVLK